MMAAESSRSRRFATGSVSEPVVSSLPRADGRRLVPACSQTKLIAAPAMQIARLADACRLTAVDARKVKSGGASMLIVGMGREARLTVSSNSVD